ncbi:uncharacterized protein [Hemitrygon akajei]|uniref:uncharacterized protein isoform X3 n=1 Tax=Hemitrygon akajei TaxID=2704970 RepID=UPI003BF9946E
MSYERQLAIREECSEDMELGCKACCDVLKMALQKDLTAEDLLRFHQCLCQGPTSLQSVQGALSLMYSKMSGVCDPETLLDSLLEQHRKQEQLEQLLWNVQMLNCWSWDHLSLPECLDPPCNENQKSVRPWRHLQSHQMMRMWMGSKVGRFELDSLKVRLRCLGQVQQERHRVSTRWAIGGVSAVIHDDGQDMECLGPEGKDVLSKSHLLRLVEQKYQMLVEQLHQKRLQKHWEMSSLRLLLLDLHQCCEREMSSILSTPMTSAQRTRLFLSQHYLQCQAQHQDTFETAALVLGIADWKKSVQAPQLCESRNEMLAMSQLQDFICTITDQKRTQPVITAYDPKALALLGRIHIQKIILEQLCKNHQEEQSLLLQFIYKQMMPSNEPCAEKLAFSDAAVNSQNNWVNLASSKPGDLMGDKNGYLQPKLLEEAFILYWQKKEITVQSKSQSPAIVGLMELQLMQMTRVRQLTQQMEGQSVNDLINTYCSLHSDLRNNQHYNNLAAMFLGLVTPEMDIDQIGQAWGSAAVAVHDRMDDGLVMDISCKDELTSGTPQQVRQMDDIQKLQNEEGAASSDTIKTARVTGRSNNGFSELQPRDTQSHGNSSQIQSSPDVTFKETVLEVQKVEEEESQEEIGLVIPNDNASTNVKCEVCDAPGDLVGDQMHLEKEADPKPRELDPISVAQNGEQMLQISSSQSQQEEIKLDILLDQVSVKAKYKGEQDLMQEQQNVGKEIDSKARDLPRIGGLRNELNMVLLSDEEKMNVLRSLAHVQRKAEEKRRRDKERQTLRVQEGLSIAQNRASALDGPLPQTCGQVIYNTYLHKESAHWRTRVRETLEQLRQERTFILRSKGERNRASFKKLFNPVETKDLTDGKNQSEHSKEVGPTEIHITHFHNPQS